MMIKSIQGLRALAIICIFLNHTSVFISEDTILMQKIFGNLGALGVYIFIILSGFLSIISYYNKDLDVSFRGCIKFTWTKVKKLYLLHIITFIVTLIVKWDILIQEPFRIPIYALFNLTLTQILVPVSSINNSFNGPSWYLSMSVFIWMLTPWMIKIIRKVESWKPMKIIKLIVGIWIIQLVYLIFAQKFTIYNINPDIYRGWLTYQGPLICFSIYINGALLGMIYIKGYINLNKWKSSIYELMLFVLLIYYLYIKANSNILGLPAVEPIIMILIYILATSKGIFAQFFSANFIVHIGNISQYIFLIHGPINFILSKYLKYINTPWLFFISLILTLMISQLTNYIYINYKVKTKKVDEECICQN